MSDCANLRDGLTQQQRAFTSQRAGKLVALKESRPDQRIMVEVIYLHSLSITINS